MNRNKTFKLNKAQAKPILDATFPDYKGRTIKIEFTEQVHFYDTNWSGGTCNRYAAIRSDGFHLNLRAPAPWDNYIEGTKAVLPVDALVVEWSHFCGKDCGITIYAHPDNLPKMLPSGSEDIVEGEVIS